MANEVLSVLGNSLHAKEDGKTISTTADSLKGKYVAFYFSAHWCPPCRQFTPIFCELYKVLKAQGKEFEVVFVTGDRSEADFQSYYDHMPWMAVPFASKEVRDALNQRWEVSGIPNVVMISPEGELLNEDALEMIYPDTTGQAFPWAK